MTCEENNTVKVYEGETGRSARLRGSEHLKQLQNGSEHSVLYKNKMTEHVNGTVKFRMEITGQFKDALTRQANEAVRLSRRPGGEKCSTASQSLIAHPLLDCWLKERRNSEFRT